MVVAGREARPFVERAAEKQKLGKESVMQTIADFYVSRGYRRGKREGLKAGLEEGREEGREEALSELRKSVRRVLTRRFKRIPSSVAQKLAGADAATLGQWLEASFEAKSLKAVFTQPD